MTTTYRILLEYQTLAYRNKADLDARPNIGIAERLRVADKKLIFGGKGFDTRDFEELNDGKLSGDFSTYIKFFLKVMPTIS